MSSTGSDVTSQVALKIRNYIQKQDIGHQAWPPHVSDLEKMNSIPLCLVQVKPQEVMITHHRVQRLTASFGQDLVYAVTSGRVKPTKHVLLPFAVKSLPGNMELIQMLNRLGHSVSYSQVEEIDTALCLQKQAASKDTIPLPQNIKPGLFTTLAWDNINRLEETISGKGTSHRVNGIAVQAKPITDHSAETRGLMYKGCVRTKTWRTSFSTLTFRCMKREMTVEMCGAPRQLHGWRTHVSTAIVPLATLRGDAKKQLFIRVMCTSETHLWTINTPTVFAIIWVDIKACAMWWRKWY